MVDPVYKQREDFLMNNPWDNENYKKNNEMKKEILDILQKRTEFHLQQETPEDVERDIEGGKYGNVMRKKIRRILEDRIKSGSGYYESQLNNKYGLRASRYIRKKRARDPMGTYYRMHRGGIKGAKKNPWIKFLKKFRKENPQLNGRQVMKCASAMYNQNKYCGK